MNEFTRKALEFADAMVVAKCSQQHSNQYGGLGEWSRFGREHKEARSALLAHLEGAEQKWLPIETAPKDGESVILGFKDFSAEGFWMDDPARNHWRETGWFFSDDDILTGHPTHPTYWQPLPATPTEEQP
jgi:hypothetical protein